MNNQGRTRYGSGTRIGRGAVLVGGALAVLGVAAGIEEAEAATLTPGTTVALYSNAHKRFLRMQTDGTVETSTGFVNAQLEPGSAAERFKVVDGGGGKVGLYNESAKFFLRINGDGAVDHGPQATALQDGWLWERFQAVDLGGDETALYNPDRKRFLRMKGGTPPAIDSSPSETSVLPASWQWERFRVVLASTAGSNDTPRSAPAGARRLQIEYRVSAPTRCGGPRARLYGKVTWDSSARGNPGRGETLTVEATHEFTFHGTSARFVGSPPVVGAATSTLTVGRNGKDSGPYYDSIIAGINGASGAGTDGYDSDSVLLQWFARGTDQAGPGVVSVLKVPDSKDPFDKFVGGPSLLLVYKKGAERCSELTRVTDWTLSGDGRTLLRSLVNPYDTSPIADDAGAKVRCPNVCAAPASWAGTWRPRVEGRAAQCDCDVGAGTPIVKPFTKRAINNGNVTCSALCDPAASTGKPPRIIQGGRSVECECHW